MGGEAWITAQRGVRGFGNILKTLNRFPTFWPCCVNKLYLLTKMLVVGFKTHFYAITNK